MYNYGSMHQPISLHATGPRVINQLFCSPHCILPSSLSKWYFLSFCYFRCASYFSRQGWLGISDLSWNFHPHCAATCAHYRWFENAHFTVIIFRGADDFDGRGFSSRKKNAFATYLRVTALYWPQLRICGLLNLAMSTCPTFQSCSLSTRLERTKYLSFEQPF